VLQPKDELMTETVLLSSLTQTMKFSALGGTLAVTRRRAM